MFLFHLAMIMCQSIGNSILGVAYIISGVAFPSQCGHSEICDDSIIILTRYICIYAGVYATSNIPFTAAVPFVFEF